MISPVFFPAPDLLVNFLLSFLLSTTFILNNNLKKRCRALLDSVRSEVKQKNLNCWYSQVVPSLRKQTDFPPVALHRRRYFLAAQATGGKSVFFHRLRRTTFPVHLKKQYLFFNRISLKYILPIQTPTKNTMYSMYSL